MPNLDLSFTVTAIIAVCALLSPVLTAVVNNRHALRMKQLEQCHADEVRREEREQEIYEGYVCATGACAQSASGDNLTAFGKHSALAQYHVSETLRANMAELDRTMRGGDLPTRVSALSCVIVQLRKESHKP